MLLFTNSAPASVTNAGGTNYWYIGSLGATSNVTLMIVAQATAAAGATLLDTATVTSSVFDPYKLNNFTSYKVVVLPAPALSISNNPGAHDFLISWPSAATNYVLFGATNLPPSGSTNGWIQVTGGITTNSAAGTDSVTITNGLRFFILKTVQN